MRLHAQKLSKAGAIVAALGMLLLSLGNTIGIYQNAVEQMQGWHMFYSPDVVGTISGMVEAAVITYITLFVFATIYNRFVGKGEK